MTGPSLPSVLPPKLALQDIITTPQQIASGLGKVTNPAETPIFICGFKDCNRLYPNRERLMAHRKRDHNSTETTDIITWND